MVFVLFLHSPQTWILVHLEGYILNGKYMYYWTLALEIEFQELVPVTLSLWCNDPYNCFQAIIQ